MRWINRQTRAINIHAMDKQIDRGNQYTYLGITDGQGQLIYLRWMNRQTRAINIPTMDEERQGQSLCLRWTKRQTRAINIPMMVEPTDKNNQYTYYG